MGLGITWRGGTTKWSPSQENVSCVHILGIMRTASSHMERESAGSMPKPPSSCSVMERPGPNSRAPLGRVSRAAGRRERRGGRRVGGRRKEVVLAFPQVVEADLVGELHLLKGVMVGAELAV